MSTSYTILVTVHVLSAIVWAGGVLFIGAVALPASRSMDEERGREAVSAIARRFRPVGWAALAVLVTTGFWMTGFWGATVENVLDTSFFSSPLRHRILGYKVSLVLLMLVVSGVHDWYVGPRATRLARQDGPEEATPWRRAAAVLGGLTALLVLAIVVFAVLVARPWLAA